MQDFMCVSCVEQHKKMSGMKGVETGVTNLSYSHPDSRGWGTHSILHM